jgi:hypothetical protein
MFRRLCFSGMVRRSRKAFLTRGVLWDPPFVETLKGQLSKVGVVKAWWDLLSSDPATQIWELALDKHVTTPNAASPRRHRPKAAMVGAYYGKQMAEVAGQAALILAILTGSLMAIKKAALSLRSLLLGRSRQPSHGGA